MESKFRVDSLRSSDKSRASAVATTTVVQVVGPRLIAFSWFITTITRVYGTYNTSSMVLCSPTYNVWGPHIVGYSWSCNTLPSGYVKIAIENDHGNSECSNQKGWFSIAML